MKIGILEVHELAHMVPMATESEQNSLVLSIKESGQQEDIVLYRNQIIDGRCRALACLALGIEVKCRHIPNNTSLPEVSGMVKDLNIRRNLTATQKAIVAYKYQLNNPKLKQKIVREIWGVGIGQYNCAQWLGENEPVMLETLNKGNTVIINGGRKTTSIQIACKYYKKKLELTAKEFSEEPGFDPDGYFDTVNQGDYYNELISRIGTHTDKEYSGNAVRTIIASLIKSMN